MVLEEIIDKSSVPIRSYTCHGIHVFAGFLFFIRRLFYFLV